MSDIFKSRHHEQRRTKDADQAEFAAVMYGSAVADQGIYDEKVAGALDDAHPPLDPRAESWQERDLATDSAVGRITEELERRHYMMGDAYPFSLIGGKLEYTRSQSGFYEFCLAASLAQQITAGEFVNFPRIFERLSAVLIQIYFGEFTRSMHLGTPRNNEIGTRFVDAMRHAHRETGEWFWGPDPDLPDNPTDTGDHGVDFVVWKRPPDGRLGSLFILGQCACGDDWTTKLADVNLQRYGKWFNPLSYVTPVRAFAIPFHASDGWLLEGLRQSGLFFDRARLTTLAERTWQLDEYKPWIERINDLTRLVAPAVLPAENGAISSNTLTPL